MKKVIATVSFLLFISFLVFSQKERPRELGISIGVLKTGTYNSITDVPGVKVGHVTIKNGEVNTGVTAIIPHEGNIFQQKVPAAIYVSNGFGKLMGISQVNELGTLETPVILTNTLSVPTAANALIKYTLNQKGNERVRSVNSVVGETNDGRLNDIRGLHVKEQHILDAINKASGEKIEEGSIGAGTGTVCFGFKGGIGTSSRVLPDRNGGYVIGVLVQTNYGGVLQVDGVPVGEELGKYYMKDEVEKADGSCMIVVATNAPVEPVNLERLAKRAIFGLAKTGGIASNGSGDYVIAFSTDESMRVPYRSQSKFLEQKFLRDDEMSPLFLAVIEATEEAIINSLFMAEPIENTNIQALPVNKVLEILKKYNKVD